MDYLKVKVLDTLCGKPRWCRGLQSSTSISYIWSQWGFSRAVYGAELLSLLSLHFFHYDTVIKNTYKCHGLETDLLAQQVYRRWSMEGESNFQQPIYQFPLGSRDTI